MTVDGSPRVYRAIRYSGDWFWLSGCGVTSYVSMYIRKYVPVDSMVRQSPKPSQHKLSPRSRGPLRISFSNLPC